MDKTTKRRTLFRLLSCFIATSLALSCCAVGVLGEELDSFKPLSEDSVVMLIGSLATPPTPWLSTLESRIRVAAESGVDTVVLCVYTNCVENSYEELDRIVNLAAESGIGVMPRIEVTSQTFTKWILTHDIAQVQLPDYTDAAQLEYGIELLKRVIRHLEAFPNVVAYQIEWGFWGESWINAPFWDSPSSKHAFLQFLHGLSSEFDRFNETNVADWVDGEIMCHSPYYPGGDVRRDPVNVAEFHWYQHWRDETTRQITWTFREAARQVTKKPIAGFSYVKDHIAYVYTAQQHLDIAHSDRTPTDPAAANRCCGEFLRDAYFAGLHLGEYDFNSRFFAKDRAEEAIASMYSRGIIPSIFYPHYVDEINDDDIPLFVGYINKYKSKISGVERAPILVAYGGIDVGVSNEVSVGAIQVIGGTVWSNEPPGVFATMFNGGLTFDIVDSEVYNPSLGNEYETVVVTVPSDSVDFTFQNRLSETNSNVIVAHPSFLVGTPTVDSPTTVTSAIFGMWNPLSLNGQTLRMQVQGNEPGATVEFQGALAHLGKMADYQANHLFSYYEGDFDEVYAVVRMDGYTAPVIARIGNIILFGLDVHIFDDAHRALCQEAFLQLVDDEAIWTGPAENDRDGDGVPDDKDYCPDYPGSKAANGC